jgi:hypothetical protein
MGMACSTNAEKRDAFIVSIGKPVRKKNITKTSQMV